jgi:hypothetical protein
MHLYTNLVSSIAVFTRILIHESIFWSSYCAVLRCCSAANKEPSAQQTTTESSIETSSFTIDDHLLTTEKALEFVQMSKCAMQVVNC